MQEEVFKAMEQRTGRIEILDQVTSKDLKKYSGSKIDVLIPAHNSEGSIDKVIRNLSKQRIPINSHLHIVVCANACKDNTANVAKKALHLAYSRNKSINTSLIVTAQPGEPQALNKMLKKVGNEIVIVVNDDVEPSESSLISLYVAMRNNEHISAIGVPSRPFPEFTGLDQPLPIRIANRISKIYTERDIIIIGRMYAFRKSILNHFPNLISEDNYLTYMSLCKAKCYGILKNKQSYVYFKPPSTYTDVFKQVFMHSRSGIQFFRKYPEAFNFFIKMEEQMKTLKEREEPIEDQEVKDVAQLIQDCCWRIASLVEKINPTKGSFRKRVASTAF